MSIKSLARVESRQVVVISKRTFFCIGIGQHTVMLCKIEGKFIDYSSVSNCHQLGDKHIRKAVGFLLLFEHQR